jgi:hypothetical protein
MRKSAVMAAMAIILSLAGCAPNTPSAVVQTSAPALPETAGPTAISTPTPAPSPTPTPAPVPTPTPAPTADPVILQAQGRFDGNAYENDFFGMTMAMPKAWIAAPQEMIELLELASGSLDEAEKRYYCFHVDSKASGDSSYMEMTCIRLNDSSSAQTPEDFLKNMEDRNFQAEPISINGVAFARHVEKLDMVTDTYYCTNRSGYMLVFFTRSYNKKDAAAMQNAIDSIEFE